MSSSRSRSIPVERGDIVELEIVALGEGPDGLGKIGDYVVFVPGVLPGERVEVRISSAARKFGRGEVIEVFAAAPERVEPLCAHFLDCGGCHRQHQDYRTQLEDKRARLQRGIDWALGDDSVAVDAVIPARPPHGQRHKVVVHLRNGQGDRLEACFHRLRSADLVAVHECPTSDPLAWDLAMRAVELLHRLPHGAWDPDFAPDDLLRSVLVRTTTTGEAHLLFVAREAFIPGLDRLLPALHDAGATTISVNGNRGEFSQLLGRDTEVVSGPPRIRDRIGGMTYLLSPTAFFQTSPQAAAGLVGLVCDWLAPGAEDDVADLYCGAGLLTLALARTARSAFGIELNRVAIQDAMAAARENGIGNVQWRSGSVEGVLAEGKRGGLPRPRLVAMDPPRSGLDPMVVAQLGQIAPTRLAYVSCEPKALQRDLAALREVGFRTVAVRPIDMFPFTCHVEAVACLELVRQG